MKKSVKYLLTFFGFLLIVVTIFYLYDILNVDNYKEFTKEFQLKNSPYNKLCTELNRKECTDNEKCIVFSTSSDKYTMDVVFDGCYGLTDEQIEKHRENKKLCSTENGNWLDSRECICKNDSINSMYQIFREGYGCIDFDKECELAGGTWSKNSAMYSSNRNCICSNGEPYSYKTRSE